MIRVKYIAILILSFLFFSCENIYLDMDNVNFSLDKNIYNIGENIVLSYNGNIGNAKGKGNVSFNLQLEETKNELTSSSITLVDSGNLIKKREEFLYDNNKQLDAYIIKNAEINNLAGQIIMRLDKSGDYVFRITVGGATKKQYKGGHNFFYLRFKVEEKHEPYGSKPGNVVKPQ